MSYIPLQTSTNGVGIPVSGQINALSLGVKGIGTVSSQNKDIKIVGKNDNSTLLIANSAKVGIVPNLPAREVAKKSWIGVPIDSVTRNVEWDSVCWSQELGLFCAVGYRLLGGLGAVMTSQDGKNWKNQVSPQHAWKKVCWSPELNMFCAVSPNGGGSESVMTSPDGENWTSRVAEDNEWFGVCWSPQLGLFCAVATSGTNRIMTSPDGVAWTPRPISGSSTDYWYSVCWADELGVFVATGQSDAGTGTGNVMISSDGINWRKTGEAIDDEAWIDVIWSRELRLLVAVDYSGGLTSLSRVKTSPDGIIWTKRTTSNKNWTSLAWSAELGLFASVANNGGIMTSPDGITWTETNVPFANVWKSVCWSPKFGMFLATSQDGTHRVMTSPNQGIPGNNFKSYGTGTNYVFTTSYTGIAFSGTSPSTILEQAGTYLVMGQAQLRYSGAKVTNETALLKIRHTNNSGIGDISSGALNITLHSGSGLMHTLGTFQIPPIIYQTMYTGDALALYGNISSTLGLGGLIAESSGTSIMAIRLF